jgi:hypothetical protein
MYFTHSKEDAELVVFAERWPNASDSSRSSPGIFSLFLYAAASSNSPILLCLWGGGGERGHICMFPFIPVIKEIYVVLSFNRHPVWFTTVTLGPGNILLVRHSDLKWTDLDESIDRSLTLKGL